MTKDKPNASITINYYDDRTEVKIKDHEKINPRIIQRSFGRIFPEWKRLIAADRRVSVARERAAEEAQTQKELSDV